MEGKLQVENPLNKPMHYGNDGPRVGVVPTPGYLPMPKIYSGSDCLNQYNQMQKDLYISQKTARPKKKGAPKIIKILFGAFAAYILCALAKPSLTKFFGKFKR